MDQTKQTPSTLDAMGAVYPVPDTVAGDVPQLTASHVLPRHPALDAAPDIPGLLSALRRRWVPALLLAVVAAATVGPLAWYVFPPSKYTARCSLLIATVPRRIMFQPNEGTTNYQTYQRTVLARLKDQSVISHALNSPRLAGLPTFKNLIKQDADVEEWLSKNLSASFRANSEVLEIALSGDYPQDLADIVNSVVDSYMLLVVKEERDARLARLEKLKELYARYQRDLKVKRNSLKELAKFAGSGDPAALALAQQYRASQLSLTQSELMRTDAELLKAQSEVVTLEKQSDPAAPRPAAAVASAPEPPSDEEIAAAVERHPDVAGLAGSLATVERKYHSALELARNNKADRSVSHYLKQWQGLHSDLTAARKRARAEILRNSNAAGAAEPNSAPVIEARQRELARLRAQIEVLESYREALAKNADRLQREVQDSSKNSLDLESERQELAIASDFAQRVGAEVEAVTVELEAEDRVKLLSQAKAPKLKDESRRIKAAGGAALASFALCLLGVSFWEFRARRVDSHDEVVRILGMKLVGTLPDPSRRPRQLPAPSNRPAESAEGPQPPGQDPLVESVNATRTMLLHASRLESVRVVMITSAIKGEGKTSLSCHLATSLARTGRRVLLIDGDLRSPAVHRLFRRSRTDGLAELLRGEVALADTIQQTDVPNLEMIAAGQCDATAVHALSHDSMRDLFARLKNEFDFVIVDSAPILPLADSLLLAQKVDGVIFSVLRHHSRLPHVHNARERLAVLGVKVLGAVVSGVRADVYQTVYHAEA